MSRDSASVTGGPSESVPRLVAGLGGVFFLSFVSEVFLWYGVRYVYTSDFVVGLSVSLAVILPLVVGGYRLARSDLDPDRYPRIVKWVAGGLCCILLINLPMIAVWSPGGFPEAFAWARWAANLGAAAGLLIGYVEARAIQRELEAQRATIRAETAENQQQWLDYLNGLLRHEVLNSANVITGYASLLLEGDEIDEEARNHLERIRRQGEDMTAVIRDVQVLIESANDAARLESRDLSAVLADELDRLRDAADSVTVEASVPEGTYVRADDLLPRVFSNLLRNAVEHNDSDRPEVRVTVEGDAETVTVDVADNGPGVPDPEQTTLFDRSDNTGGSHGLGLYLVRTLVERYGGAVELTETGPDGTRFTVELPAAEPPSGGAAPAQRDDRREPDGAPGRRNHRPTGRGHSSK